MARRAFYSFHYIPDNWRASQVRNMGVIEGNKPATDNEWEEINKSGDAAIKNWIDDQLYGKSVVIVLIGQNTAGRKWINYEIVSAWDSNKGALGIYVHNLKDASGYQSNKGQNPFDYITLGGTTSKLSSILKVYNPPYYDSKQVYNYIKENLADWIEDSVQIRANS